MDLAAAFDAALVFITDHRAFAGPIFGLLAFGESMVVIGVLFPATGLMMAAGALVGSGTLPFVDLWIGGALGAALGDAVSFWIGGKLGPAVHRLWPFSRHPEMLEAAHRVFDRWGWVAIVVGRFIGPLRASVPTVAGLAGMPIVPFQLANFGSAILWIPVLIAPGSAGALIWRSQSELGTGWALGALIGLVVVVVGGVLLVRRRLAGSVLAGVEGGSEGTAPRSDVRK